MPNYKYESMWAGPPKYDGTYDVEDFITGLIRTEGPTITINGAWAQNVGVGEMFVDFMGDKAGIRLEYSGDYTLYSIKDGKLTASNDEYKSTDMFQEEIDAFLRCITTGEKLPSHIDTAIITAKIMQALYDSSAAGKEIAL
jgi:predicted dehydrogenase